MLWSRFHYMNTGCVWWWCRDWGIQDGDQFVVSGSLPQLGNWQQDQPLLLSEVQAPFWEAEVIHAHQDKAVTHVAIRRSKSNTRNLHLKLIELH